MLLFLAGLGVGIVLGCSSWLFIAAYLEAHRSRVQREAEAHRADFREHGI